MGARLRVLRPWMLASALYTGLTVALTWPLLIQLNTTLASDLGDPLLNMWILWWNAHAVPFTERWWNAPMFWPAQGALGFSELLVGISVLTSPLQWMGVSPSAAYNTAFLLSYPLAAIGGYALAFSLTRRHDAALVAGLAYGFNPYRVAHYPQLQMLVCGWMPIALAALHEYVRAPRRAWLGVFAAAWLLQAFSNGYYLLFFPVLLGLWLAWFGTVRENRPALPAIVGTWAMASLPIAVALWKYRAIHAFYGFHRFPGEIESFSADIMSLFDATEQLRFWHLTRFHHAEGELFPGSIAPLLIALVLAGSWRRSAAEGRSRTSLELLAAAAFFAAIALSPLVFGPWSITVGARTLLSVRVISKPLTFAGVLLGAALAFDPRFRAVIRRRSPFMFYVLAAAAMFVLALGPSIKFLGVPLMYKSPYALLTLLPGYDSIRVPARFAMLAALCVSAAAALAFARLTDSRSRPVRLAAAGLVAVWVLIDGWIGPMPLVPLPARLAALESGATGAVVELPIGETEADTAAMYRATFHQRPLVNGYSGFFPPSDGVVRHAFTEGDYGVIEAMTSFGPVTLAVDPAHDDGGKIAKRLSEHPRISAIGEEAGWRVFSAPASTWPTAEASGSRLPIASISASTSEDQIKFMTDGDLGTRWASGPQNGGEVVTIDLGSVRTVERVSLSIGRFTADYPRHLTIDTSADGTSWSDAWSGRTAPAAWIAAVRHPRDVPLEFLLNHPSARFVRMKQVSFHPVYYWSIAELGVFGR